MVIYRNASVWGEIYIDPNAPMYVPPESVSIGSVNCRRCKDHMVETRYPDALYYSCMCGFSFVHQSVR